MDVTRLGRTGLKVSRICLGTMNFGPETEEADAHRIMDRAIDSGLNFFDTANVYGWGENKGRTETIIGRWLAQGGRRDRIVLATKVYGPMHDAPNGGKLSAYHIRRACEDSLRRLQTDRIDLYQMHHIDRETPWEEIWQAIELLVAQGKVLYAGSSNFAAWNIVQGNEAAARRGLLGLVSEQSLYNLGARTIELEVVPACRAYGVGIIPYSPLGGGLLGGALKKVASGRRASERIQKEVEKHRPKLEAYEKLCGEIGEKPANVAVAWLLHRPGVTAPIVGPRTLDQLEDAVRAEKLKLTSDMMSQLEAIWPGPGGQAPEAYAW
jgi:NDP-hexose C3-ketoreductase / dTDP-4-oxo-2-deoxy-alpha-D-pentos-2-ene 2,3-reductase